jgi:hypothetical protein
MNCYDCATQDQLTRAAVGICHDCGAALCVQHARVVGRYLTRIAVINRVVTVDPPARVIYCATCAAAHEAAAHSTGRRAGHRST